MPACKDKRYLLAVIGAAVLLVVTVNYFMDRHSFAVNGTMAYAYWFNAIIIPEYFACWLWILVCVICGILITNLLKLIPIVRKYL